METGGSNVQFAINPRDGEMVVIEMNPRVSRSSALASKATGFPIAKIAAKLAVGYSLDELANDITRETRASFEPTIDYCVVKMPRFTFEKFPKTQDILTVSMKSVGETMAIGRTFKESLQKAIRSLEIGRFGFVDPPADAGAEYLEELKENLRRPNSERLFQIGEAFKLGLSVPDIYELTQIDPWFLHHIQQIIEMEAAIRRDGLADDPQRLHLAKSWGFSDVRLGQLTGTDEETIRQRRLKHGIVPVYKLVDTCAAEFEAYTPYYYSTYETENEARPSDRPKVVILGGGPNRIGQGIEFDYCCVHASFALAEENHESIMINSNPETVSTDYDTSDKLYFEPLTREDVLHILRHRTAQGRHRSVRRSNAAQPGGAAGEGRRPDPRDFPRRHRSCRRPQTFPADAAEARAQTTAQRHRFHRRRSLVGGRGHRLSCSGPAVLRVGRTGHGNRLRRQHAARIHGNGGARVAGPSHPHRPVPGRCRRTGCGRHQRRPHDRGGRHHGTHRGGRDPFR